jgi:glutamate--cysteine ligase
MESIAVEVPFLTTAQSGPLQELERKLLCNQPKIEAWLRQQWRKDPPPFYSSVDLRNAGFKLAPVDTNLFPAGFNNLNRDFLPLCVQAVQAALEAMPIHVTQILLVPENHTRNLFYLESLALLREVLLQAGFSVEIGTLRSDITVPTQLKTQSGQTLTLYPLEREGNRTFVRTPAGLFHAEMLLLNHDLSGAVPPILEGLDQLVQPPLHLGWATRLKSQHFAHYQDVATEFAQQVGFDPWWISPIFSQCHEVDFVTKKGEECLIATAEQVFAQISAKYQEYEIPHKPYIVVKTDAGSYGMGVMSASSVEELRTLNHKRRGRMSTTKGGEAVTKVLIQEGVYSFETVGEAVAEPVVYMIGNRVVGGFYRVHADRSPTENLNSPGASFRPLAFSNSCNLPDFKEQNGCTVNRFYSYGVIARLAALAAGREQTKKEVSPHV